MLFAASVSVWRISGYRQAVSGACLDGSVKFASAGYGRDHDDMDFSAVIKTRRAALGLSQGQLAERAGVSSRQLARYEAGEQQPVLSAAVTLADALGISLTQLAGQVSYDLDLSGNWWAGWQTWKNGEPRIDTHTLEINQRGEILQLLADRATPVADGS